MVGGLLNATFGNAARSPAIPRLAPRDYTRLY